MINLTELNDIDGYVKIQCADGENIIGRVYAIEDYTVTGIGETGVLLTTLNGIDLCLGVSEISSFEPYELVMKIS